MVIGVKELGHVQGDSTLRATSHSKVQVIAGKLGETGRSQAQSEDPVKNLVVQRSVEANLGNACTYGCASDSRQMPTAIQLCIQV